MKMTIIPAAIVAASLMFGAALPAHAALLNWTLSGVEFSDGTTATGSITMDPTERTSSSFSVSTFDGALTKFTFDNSNSGLYFGGGAGPNNFILFNTTGRRYFNFSFVNPLAPLGGEFTLNTASSYECMNCSPFRHVTAGSLTTLDAEIPEPSTGALLLPALGMIGWMMRRRKQQTAK